MENRSPSASASAWLTRKPPVQDDQSERDAEVARLRERLNFYESFDSLIQENVSRAGELLRHAASMREDAQRSVAEMRKEVEAAQLSERQELRALLSGLLDEVTTTQVQVERLARRVADALDDLEASLPANVDFDDLPMLNLPVAALRAPETAVPLDPTPEELAPKDPATIAAERSAGSAATVVEADAVAAEADWEGSDDTATAGDRSPSAPDETVERLDHSGEAAERDVQEPVTANPPAETVTTAERTVATDAATEAADAELDEVAASADPEQWISDESATWAVGEARFLNQDAAPNGETSLNPEAIERPEAASGEPQPESPQVDDAAIASGLTEPAEQESEPVAPPTSTEDVLDRPEAAEDAAEAAAAASNEPEQAAPATALEDIVAEPVAESERPAASAGSSEATTEEPRPLQPVAETVVETPEPVTVAAQAAAPTVAERGGAPPRLPWIPDDIRPFSTEGIGTAIRRGTAELRLPEPAPRPTPIRSGTGPLAARGTGTVVLVHGVPRATTALSLKRYLESLPHVSSVEPREYAEGILRLHVVGERHIRIDELRGWADGRELQPVHVREDLIEVSLPT